MSSEAIPVPPAPPDSAESGLRRLIGVFVSPSKTFASIAARPTWILPVGIAAALALPLSELILSHMDWRAALLKGMARSGRTMPEAQMDALVERMRGLSWLWDAVAVAAPVVVTLIVAAVLWGSCQAFGWEVRYRQSLGITAHAFFPATLGSIALLVVLWNRNPIDPDTVGDVLHLNLGFLADPKDDRVLHSLLGSVDLFALWGMGLLALGLSSAAGASRKRMVLLVLSLWVLFVLGKAGYAALRA